jgi:DNA-binding NarL/FixJ family response regulator
MNHIQEVKPAQPTTPPAPSSGPKPFIEVWLIEDNHIFRNAVVRLLNESHDIRCTESFSACEEAITQLNAGAKVDVLLLDVQLSGMNGIEALPKIKAIVPNLCVIMLTVFEDHEKIFKAICAGASGYLLKTSALETIVESVHQVMAGGSPMSPRVATSVLKMFKRLSPPKDDFALTERERQVLELMVNGLSKKEIAARLEISFHTVDYFLRNIYEKLHVHSQAGAVARAIRENICER